MKFFLNAVLLLALSAILSGCHVPVLGESGPTRQERYEQAAKSWEGRPIGSLMNAWPRVWLKDETSLADDSRVYTFIRSETQYRQAEQYFDHANNEWVESRPGGNVLVVCETKFFTGPEGLITSVTPGGSDCGELSLPPARSQ